MVENYKKLKDIKIENVIPKTFFPTPSELNYEFGFIERYFVQTRATPGSPIFEIDENVYSKFSGLEDYYVRLSLKWKIKGNLDDRYTEKGEYVPGVHTINRLAIKEAEKIIPEINLYLVNTKQFHRLA